MIPLHPLPPYICHLQGDLPGPRVVVFGGTHGDETTGVEVIRIILDRLGLDAEVPNGTHLCASVRGDLFLGIGNPQAVTQGTRSVSGIRDLNRCFHEIFFTDDQQMQLPDQRRAAELKNLLARAQYFIDLHSVSAPQSIPFIGLTTFSQKHAFLCSFFPVSHILNANTILAQDVGIDETLLEQTPTTCSWVNRHGGTGLAYEMGFQQDLTSVPRAVQALLSALLGIGAINAVFLQSIGVSIDPITVRVPPQQVYRLVSCEKNLFKNFVYINDRYTQNWLPVHTGEIIGRYQDGQEVRVRQDGFLVFPAGKHTLNTNQSLFYLAIEETAALKEKGI